MFLRVRTLQRLLLEVHMYKLFARDPHTDWLVAGMLACLAALLCGMVAQ